jgi:GH24 family phage-related lysozyme (muramidase)
MYKSVREVFPKFTSQFEGRVSWMYQDVKGLVTIGLGCLIDPSQTAQGLPFVHISDGRPATTNDIDLEWIRIKKDKELAQQGYLAARRIAQLMLTDSGIDNLARTRLEQNESYLKTIFHDWEEWPADSQLGVFSMAWAMGAGFVRFFPTFTKACQAHDWTTAAKQCLMKTTDNAGLIQRNHANVKLFTAAATPSILPLRILRGYP